MAPAFGPGTGADLRADPTLRAAIRRAVEEWGEGLYAIELETDDRAAALEALADRGLTFGGPDDNETTVFGARILVEENSL